MSNTNSASFAKLEKQVHNLQKKTNNNNRRPRRPTRKIPQRASRARVVPKVVRSVQDGVGPDFMKIHSRESDYFKTLKDPFNYNGAKIPDNCTYPSSTFTTTTRMTLTAFTGDDGKVYAGIGAIGLQPNACVFTLTSCSPDGLFTWTGADLGGSGLGNLPGWVAIQQNFQRLRPVSAGLCVMSSNSSLTDQGSMLTSNVPSNTRMDGDGYYNPTLPGEPWAGLDSFKNAFGSVTVPVNQKGLCTCYRPTDPACFEYVDFGYTEVDADDIYLNYGNLAILITGCAANSTFEVVLQINYEAIPKLAATGMINVSPSRADPIDLAMSLNKAATLPLGEAKFKQAEKLSAKALTNHPPQTGNPTFMEKILNGIAKYGPMVGKAAMSVAALL